MTEPPKDYEDDYWPPQPLSAEGRAAMMKRIAQQTDRRSFVGFIATLCSISALAGFLIGVSI